MLSCSLRTDVGMGRHLSVCLSVCLSVSVCLDTQTDTKLIVAFRNFSRAPKNLDFGFCREGTPLFTTSLLNINMLSFFNFF